MMMIALMNKIVFFLFNFKKISFLLKKFNLGINFSSSIVIATKNIH